MVAVVVAVAVAVVVVVVVAVGVVVGVAVGVAVVVGVGVAVVVGVAVAMSTRREALLEVEDPRAHELRERVQQCQPHIPQPGDPDYQPPAVVRAIRKRLAIYRATGFIGTDR